MPLQDVCMFKAVDHGRCLEEVYIAIKGTLLVIVSIFAFILNVFHRIPLWQFFHFCPEG